MGFAVQAMAGCSPKKPIFEIMVQGAPFVLQGAREADAVRRIARGVGDEDPDGEGAAEKLHRGRQEQAEEVAEGGSCKPLSPLHSRATLCSPPASSLFAGCCYRKRASRSLR